MSEEVNEVVVKEEDVVDAAQEDVADEPVSEEAVADVAELEAAEADVAQETEEVVAESESDESSDDSEPKTVQESTPTDGRRWYIVQCFTGHEYKVHARIEHLLSMRDDLRAKVFRVLVPEEETVEIKNNKRVERTTKIYPGYVFVEMIYDESVYFQIRSIAGVTQFVGSKTGPTPVTEDEILRVLRKIGDKTRKIDVDFEIGEVIKVMAGPFRGYTGPISEINAEKGTLKALLSVFGRETPVKLDFDHVESTVE